MYRTVWTIWRYLLRIPGKKAKNGQMLMPLMLRSRIRSRSCQDRGTSKFQGTSDIGNPLVVPESCTDVETLLVPLADSERDSSVSLYVFVEFFFPLFPFLLRRERGRARTEVALWVFLEIFGFRAYFFICLVFIGLPFIGGLASSLYSSFPLYFI